jgi:hypothetical protein
LTDVSNSQLQSGPLTGPNYSPFARALAQLYLPIFIGRKSLQNKHVIPIAQLEVQSAGTPFS